MLYVSCHFYMAINHMLYVSYHICMANNHLLYVSCHICMANNHLLYVSYHICMTINYLLHVSYHICMANNHMLYVSCHVKWVYFQFTALLRLPGSMPRAEKKQRIMELVDALDMEKCLHTSMSHNAFGLANISCISRVQYKCFRMDFYNSYIYLNVNSLFIIS